MTTNPQRIVLANALAADYFRDCLHSSIGDGPRRYLHGRGVSDEALRRRVWEIGYAPPGWTSLIARLRSWPFTDQELLDTGLAVVTRRGTLIDRFRDRVMFGILEGIDNRIIVGFVGRCSPNSGDSTTPKYLNSPNGLVYDKSRYLFGLGEQRSMLRVGARPLLVEGPLDVLAVSRLRLEVTPVTPAALL